MQLTASASKIGFRGIGHDKKLYALIALLTILIITASFQLQGRIGLNLADEGYLWYGVQRVMLGEVPIRDFSSYDFGRYYWSAGLMTLLNDNGIVALRISVAVFQGIGLFLSLVILSRHWKCTPLIRSTLILLAAATLVLWMFPRHKLFDITLSIVTVTMLSYLAESPSARRYFLTGVSIGIVAIFGRNHGIYAVAGSFSLLVLLTSYRDTILPFRKAFSLWACGITIGYLPMVIAIGLVPGLFESFISGILFLFELKATNIPLPIPWPWTVNFEQLPLMYAINRVLVGCFFIAAPTYAALGLLWILYNRLKGVKPAPLLIATILMSLPYTHYAYSRADVGHLAQGIFPFLIGVLAITAKRSTIIKFVCVTFLLVFSFTVTRYQHPYFSSANWENIEVSNSQIRINPGTANMLTLFDNLVTQYAPDGRTFYAAPNLLTMYAVFERQSPTWEIYQLFPRDKAFETTEIERLKAANPGFVVLSNLGTDGRDNLRFINTHPLIYRYIQDNFKRITQRGSPLEIYKSLDN